LRARQGWQAFAGGIAVVNPGDFAAYVFTVAGAVGALGVVTGIARRVLDKRFGPMRTGVGLHLGDPEAAETLRQVTADVEALHEEVTGLRRELDEAQNRLDFTERLLAQAKERGLLSAPKERGQI
jgi:hypothetical protein